MDSFALNRENPQVQALQRGLVQQLPNAKGVTQYTNPATGQVGLSNDPNSAPWWAPYFKGLVSAGVGAGYGAAGLAAFAPETAASLGITSGTTAGELAAPTAAQGFGVSLPGALTAPGAAAPDALSVLSAAPTAAPEVVTITGDLAAQSGLTGLTAAEALGGAGAVGYGTASLAGTDGGAATGTLVDPQGNVLAQPGVPEQVAVTGQAPEVAASGLPDIGSILTTGGLAGLSAEALSTFGGAMSAPPAEGAPTVTGGGSSLFGSNFATPSGMNWTPGAGGFPVSGYTDTGGFPLGGTGGSSGGLFDDFTLRDALGLGGLGVAGAMQMGRESGSTSSAQAEKQVSDIAKNLGTQGSNLSNYLTSGTLPPGVKQSLTQGNTAAKAAIRSKFASMGMSGSTSETQALSSVDMQTQTAGVQIAEQLLGSGIQESGLSAELYTTLLNNALSQDKEAGQAVGNFATALATLLSGNPAAKKAA
jgi:hypothetical protein